LFFYEVLEEVEEEREENFFYLTRGLRLQRRATGQRENMTAVILRGGEMG